MEDDGIFYGHLVHFTVFCYILSTFGIVHGNLVYFSHFGIFFPFWYFLQRIIWQPCRLETYQRSCQNSFCTFRHFQRPNMFLHIVQRKKMSFFQRAGEQIQDLLIFVYFLITLL
jgi:hypothetical protein